MKKQELLNCFDEELLEKLLGFCYVRTSDSYEAQELCSDIVFALVKAANAQGEIENFHSFLWKVARNVYADYAKIRKRRQEIYYGGDSEEIFPFLPAGEESDAVAAQALGDGGEELLRSVYRRISFLTRAYREAMILFYLDGLSVTEIAKIQKASEVTVRQRLFSARKKVKSEVEEMAEVNNRPVLLDKVDITFWGTGSPGWGDPREVCTRQLSKHIVWLCNRKPAKAAEIAEELNVPTVYVEEELEILREGANGEYGLLRKLENGRYAINFILLGREAMEEAVAVYKEQVLAVCDVVIKHLEEHREEYLRFPYLNRKVDWNLVLWQQMDPLSRCLAKHVDKILAEKYFAKEKMAERPFSTFGYMSGAVKYGGNGWDGIAGNNLCGYSNVHVSNIYNKYIEKHFSCAHNLALDRKLLLAVRAIDGISVDSLSEIEKEDAAGAIECGYLYREGDMLYTRILVTDREKEDRLFDISGSLSGEALQEAAETAAAKLDRIIRSNVPDYLLGEWQFANILAGLSMFDMVADALVERGVLTPPKDGIGAEGCWMSVKK